MFHNFLGTRVIIKDINGETYDVVIEKIVEFMYGGGWILTVDGEVINLRQIITIKKWGN